MTDEQTDPIGTATKVPYLRVIRGNPDDVDLAAIVAVLAARAGAGEVTPATRSGGWSSRAALLRQPLRPGPGAWTAAARTR